LETAPEKPERSILLARNDCSVNDEPAFLAGLCDCGSDLPVDASELFRSLFVFGARGYRWDIRQRNIEAFIEAEEAPVGDGRRTTLTIDLPDTSGWPECGCNSNGVDLGNSVKTLVCKGKADSLVNCSHGQHLILRGLRNVLGFVRLNLLGNGAAPKGRLLGQMRVSLLNLETHNA
jgi:hypothetical protein